MDEVEAVVVEGDILGEGFDVGGGGEVVLGVGDRFGGGIKTGDVGAVF